MKKIINEWTRESTRRPIHIGYDKNDNYVYICSQCKERMKTYNLEETPAQRSRFHYMRPLLKCSCSEKYLAPDSLSCYDERHDPEIFQLLKEDKIEFSPGTFINKERLTYNEETQVLSYSESGYIPRIYNVFCANKVRDENGEKIGTIINQGFIERVSLNLRTGKFYGVSVDRQNQRGRQNTIKTGNWGTMEGKVNLYSRSNILLFIEEAIKRSGLPINVWLEKKVNETGITHYYTHFECGGVEVKTQEGDESLSFILNIIANPNIFIRYDGYTGKASFREENKRSEEPFDYYYANFNVKEAINVYLPISKEFRRIHPLELMDEGAYVKMLIEKLGIPDSRQFVKMYRKNPMTAGLVHKIMQADIKEPDNIRKAIDRLTKESFISRTDVESAFRFLKVIVKEFGETIAVNKFREKHSIGFLTDSWNMYKKVKKAGFKDMISFSGNVKQIHDSIVEVFMDMELDNRTIDYTQTEENRQFETEDYEVRLAEDTHRLADIGRKMHICVGSYAQSALEKWCTIYYFLNKKQKEYAGCIELRGSQLKQAKGFCNQLLDGERKDLLVQWTKQKKIKTKGCDDYEMIVA